MVRFLHSADLQIGKPFGGFGERAAGRLREYRVGAVERLAEAADEHDVEFAVLAGDVFDSNTLDDGKLGPALPAFGEFEVPVYILPGNHDHVGAPKAIYDRELFEAESPDRVKVLREREAVVVADGGAVLLPAPLVENQSRSDPTEHLDAEFGARAPKGAARIGVAHGGIGPRGEFTGANKIPEDRAERADLDYLALGDFHGTEQIDQRTWYSGAPERSNFADNVQGRALVVEVDRSGDPPEVTEVETGRAEWMEWRETVDGGGDVEELERRFDGLDDITESVIRLELEGTARMGVREELDDLLERKRSVALSLEVVGEVLAEPSDEEIQKLRNRGGLVSEVVDALEATDEERSDETATRALTLLNRLAGADR